MINFLNDTNVSLWIFHCSKNPQTFKCPFSMLAYYTGDSNTNGILDV
ncbi:rCG57341 [Rattus norvegicus]|uniref:RCG57341 n=1 Tax=Rattus norvegicus TaxID=10116 RepID=A6JPF4_RAT|nr:rCG57341 [Rattus norvegicus]